MLHLALSQPESHLVAIYRQILHDMGIGIAAGIRKGLATAEAGGNALRLEPQLTLRHLLGGIGAGLLSKFPVVSQRT